MSNLTDIVPPLDLCKKIPAGEFEDSVGIYVFDPYYEEWDFTLREDEDSLADIIPAPTLDELIIALLDMTPGAINICKSFNEWHVACCIAVKCGERDVSADSAINPATAALKLWLELNKNGD